MAFDYCTVPEVFAYGGSAGAATSPINEAAMMAEVITATSRAVDSACHQNFSRETYTQQRLRATIDADGVLTCYPPVPLIVGITELRYRIGAALDWQTSDLSAVDTDDRPHGSTVRLLNAGLLAVRQQRVVVQLSYTGGYADRAAMPEDLRWATRAACWYEYQRRTAPMDKTAMPSMGIVVIPGDWPKHITSKLADHTKVTPS